MGEEGGGGGGGAGRVMDQVGKWMEEREREVFPLSPARNDCINNLWVGRKEEVHFC